MAKITRIKAKDPGKRSESSPEPKKDVSRSKAVKDTTKATKVAENAKKSPKSVKKPQKTEKTQQSTEKSSKKPFILIRPFVYFGRYVRDSWREIRQVRWPSRKATWKLFFAILVYTLIFVGIIMLLDAIFTWLFETVIG